MISEPNWLINSDMNKKNYLSISEHSDSYHVSNPQYFSGLVKVPDPETQVWIDDRKCDMQDGVI